MRVLLNGLFLRPGRVGGSETYLRGLVHGLASVDSDNEYIVCVTSEAARTFELPNRRWRVLQSPPVASGRAARLLLEQTWVPRVARPLGRDVIHSTGYTGPVWSAAPRVTSIHDMNYRRHPEDLSVAELAAYHVLIPQVARTSNRILALTHSAAADIQRWTSVHASRITVAPAAPRAVWPGSADADAAHLDGVRIPRPFALSVAAAYPHKNLERLVQAFLNDGRHSVPLHLVLVGLRGRSSTRILQAVRERNDRVRVLGWVDDALLGTLYRRATVLAFPSLYEGFGIPILEAMALGTPVLTSNYGAMAEVAGDAAELVDPRDVAAIRAGLARLAADRGRRDELSRLGRARARQFSWGQTASLVLNVYERVAAPHRQ
jgi:glycosyltransferase involved in cell wall biosynthesis